jgi:hypothetical protein
MKRKANPDWEIEAFAENGKVILEAGEYQITLEAEDAEALAEQLYDAAEEI